MPIDLSTLTDDELQALSAGDQAGWARIAAAKHNVPEYLIDPIIKQESGGKQSAVSPKGATGIMQLMPGTAKSLGVNPKDWAENIWGGMKYLGTQLKEFGSPEEALAAYNAGPGAVKKYGGVPPYKETKGYVRNITGNIDVTTLSDEELQKIAGETTAPQPYQTKARMEGLAPYVMDNFTAMAQEYQIRTGKTLRVDDAFRTREMQAEGHRHKPTQVARPGHSYHEVGEALDIDEAQANELAALKDENGQSLLEKYGFTRPMMSKAPGKKYEPWHIQWAAGDLERKMGAVAGPPTKIDVTKLSDAELEKLARGESPDVDVSKMSDAELERLAGGMAPAAKPRTATIGPETKIETPITRRQPFTDPTSETLAQFAGPAGEMVGTAMDIPFVPLRKGLELFHQAVIEPHRERTIQEWADAMKPGGALEGAGAGAPEAFAALPSKETFVPTMELALSVPYLKMISKGIGLLGEYGPNAFRRHAPDIFFKYTAKGGMPVPLSPTEVEAKLMAMSGPERAEMAKKYPQFRDVMQDMTRAVEERGVAPEVAKAPKPTPPPEAVAPEPAKPAPPEPKAEAKGEVPVLGSELGYKGLAAKKYYMGELSGDTPEEAMANYQREQGRIEERAAHKAVVDTVLPKLISGNYTEADIKSITSYGKTTVSTGEAEGLLRDMGLKSTDARNIIKGTGDIATTARGAVLYDLGTVVENARRKGFLPPLKAVEGAPLTKAKRERELAAAIEPKPAPAPPAAKEPAAPTPTEIGEPTKPTEVMSRKEFDERTKRGDEELLTELRKLDVGPVPEVLDAQAKMDAITEEIKGKRWGGTFFSHFKDYKRYTGKLSKADEKLISKYNDALKNWTDAIQANKEKQRDRLYAAYLESKRQPTPTPTIAEGKIVEPTLYDGHAHDIIRKELITKKGGKEVGQEAAKLFGKNPSILDLAKKELEHYNEPDLKTDKDFDGVRTRLKAFIKAAEKMSLKPEEVAKYAEEPPYPTISRPEIVEPGPSGEVGAEGRVGTEPPKVYQDEAGWWRIEGSEAKVGSQAEAQKIADRLVNMYGFPGVSTQDLVKLADTLSDATKMKTVRPLLFPGAKSPEHLRAAEVLGSKLGTMFREGESAYMRLKPDRKMFDKMGVHDPDVPLMDNPGMKFASDVSMGRTPAPELRSAATKVNKMFENDVRMLEEAGAPLETVREFYFPGMWTKDSIRAFNQAVNEYVDAGGIIPHNDIFLLGSRERTAIRNRVDELLTSKQGSDKDALYYMTKRPLKGKESFRKEKVFDDIMDAVEFGLRPVSNNPIDLALLKHNEIQRSVMANRALREWESKGDIVNTDNSGRPLKGRKKGERPPDRLDPSEFRRISGRYGEIWIRDPQTKLPIKVGERWAKIPVADVMDNYLSESLYNNPYIVGKAYRGYMAVGNALNQSQLGWGSFFHGGFTTIETQISAGAEILKDVYGVAVPRNRTMKDLGRTVAKFPVAWLRTGIQGSKYLADWRDPKVDLPTNVPVSQLLVTQQGAPGTYAVSDPRTKVALVSKAYELGGGKTTMDVGLRTWQSEAMYRDWLSGKKGKAILRSPIALSEAMMRPVLYWMVPRQKLGVFGEMAGRIIEQNPGKTLEELRPEFRQAVNRVDARLGQVGYDRLFLNNVAKNAIQGLVRSPGWSGGTIAEVGGSGKDAAKFLLEWAREGKAPSDLPDRVAYTIALMTMMMGANGILTYAFTGEQPHGMDWWAFRDGGKDKYGNPTRWLLPSYAKDIFAYWQNWQQTLIHKTHPMISATQELWKGVNYYNEQFVDPEDNFLKRQWDRIQHIPQFLEPFWTRGMRKAGEQEGGVLETLKKSPEKIIAPEFGVMPASRIYTQTPADKLITQYFEMQGHPIKTPKMVETTKEKQKILDLFHAGKTEEAREALRKSNLTRQQKTNLKKKAADIKKYMFNQVRDLDIAVKVYDVATPEEKAIYGPALKKKINNLRDRDYVKYKQYRHLKEEINADQSIWPKGAEQ